MRRSMGETHIFDYCGILRVGEIRPIDLLGLSDRFVIIWRSLHADPNLGDKSSASLLCRRPPTTREISYLNRRLTWEPLW